MPKVGQFSTPIDTFRTFPLGLSKKGGESLAAVSMIDLRRLSELIIAGLGRVIGGEGSATNLLWLRELDFLSPEVGDFSVVVTTCFR